MKLQSEFVLFVWFDGQVVPNITYGAYSNNRDENIEIFKILKVTFMGTYWIPENVLSAL